MYHDSRQKPDLRRDRNVEVTALMVASDSEASSLRRALESGGDRFPHFGLDVVDSAEDAIERLGTAKYDAVILDLDHHGGIAQEKLQTVRERANGATLFLTGGDQTGIVGTIIDDEEWVERGTSKALIAGCLRNAIERRRLRDQLERTAVDLAASESRFTSIVEGTAEGIIIVGEDERIRFVNAGAEAMFGRSSEHLLGDEFGLALLGGETAEMDIVRNGGEPIVAELRVNATIWEGEPAQVVSLRDITHRKKAEERAQRLLLEQSAREQAEEAGRRLRFLADAGTTLDASLIPEKTLVNLANLIVPRIADWCVIDLLNGARIRRVAGVHADPARNHLLNELIARFPPEAGSPQPAARVLESGTAELYRRIDETSLRQLAVDSDHVALLKELGIRSSLTVALEAREVRFGAMTLVRANHEYDENDLALAREIASRAARALDNARLYEDALLASRSKSDFLAVMSHELRTPLNAILGYTDLLLAGISPEADESENTYLLRIRSGATRLLHMIEEILIYAQTDAGRAEVLAAEVTVGEVVDKVLRIGKPLAVEKGLDVRVDVVEPDSSIRTDAEKLRQVLLNMLTNAVKFTDEGAIDLRVNVRPNEVVFEVADTGIGIAQEDLEGIFEPFRQVEQGTTRRAGGTGLGLSVARKLAGLLGGTLQVASEPGKGSTFVLQIPRHFAQGSDEVDASGADADP